MTEQLYRIERRRAKRGEDYRARAETDTVMEVHVLVPVEPTPGTLEWARGIVRDGGAVWIDNAPWTKHANYRFYHQNGSSFWNPCEEWGRETGWHLWGDREWLMALPDGTRVDHERIGQDARRTKYGNDLIGKNGHRYPINCVVDSGWDLVREPVKAIPTPILDQDDDDDTLADLVRRVEALERKAGNP